MFDRSTEAPEKELAQRNAAGCAGMGGPAFRMNGLLGPIVQVQVDETADTMETAGNRRLSLRERLEIRLRAANNAARDGELIASLLNLFERHPEIAHALELIEALGLS